MDPALLREREAFKKRALATPVVENKAKKAEPQRKNDSQKSKKPKPSSSASMPKPPRDPLSYKTMQGSSQYKFSILAKIVKHMKQRHQEGDTHPLTLEEILDETSQLDVSSSYRHWLMTEALGNNPKIQVTADGKYQFKPPYNIKDKKRLLQLLDRYDQQGLGGIFLDDIQESLPNADKAVRILGDNLILVTRGQDKKKVVFFNDKSCQFTVDDEFQKLWRSVAVDGIDEEKIEEYLEKQGISSMQDMGLKKVTPAKRKKPASRKGKNFKRLNDHLGDVLKDYSDK